MKRSLRPRHSAVSAPDKSNAQPRPSVAKAGPLSHATLRMRVVFENGLQLGPGKIDLLEAIHRTGSISAAGREMKMSYRRAWLLVDELSRMFSRPILTRCAGGAEGGGAQLTDFGIALVSAFRRIEDRSRAVIREELAPFETSLETT